MRVQYQRICQTAQAALPISMKIVSNPSRLPWYAVLAGPMTKVLLLKRIISYSKSDKMIKTDLWWKLKGAMKNNIWQRLKIWPTTKNDQK